MIVIARIDFGFWLRRIVTWDGLLPILMWLAPWAIETVLPNRRGAIEIAAVVLPIVALFLRFHSGIRQIASNRCAKLFRGVQFAVFVIGILPLVLFDCFMMLAHLMPAGGPMAAEDVFVCTVLLLIYLTAMTIAMYPGRLPPEPTTFAILEFERMLC